MLKGVLFLQIRCEKNGEESVEEYFFFKINTLTEIYIELGQAGTRTRS